MIDYVEIRDASLELLAIVDTAKSIIWETQYFGAGAFEVYTAATPQAVSVLQIGNFVTRNDADDGVGIIEAISITFSPQDGRMITASGRLAKSILDRRLISYVSGNVNAATIFSGNVEERARGLVQDNAIACYKDKARTVPYTQRNISILQLGALKGLPAVTELRQALNDNLLTYTDEFLRQFGYGAKMIRAGNKLSYEVYSGTDRSIGNAAGNEPVIFSEDFDNFVGSNYSFNNITSKTFALIGGEGEGNDRFYVECNNGVSGLARREAFIDASSINRELYEDTFTGNGIEREPGVYTGTTAFVLRHRATALRSVKVDGKDAVWTFNASTNTITLSVAPLAGVKVVVQYVDDNEYGVQLNETGQQELATLIAAESFEGNIDLVNSSFVYGTDFEIGDIVTVQDNGIGKYINVRIVAATEVQDESGHQINITFEAV